MNKRDIREEFKKIFGVYPYDIQSEYINTVLKGDSPFYISPTGSGKTNALEMAYILGKGSVLPDKMLLINPSRTLTNASADRMKQDLSNYDLTISSHHGMSPIDPYFRSNIISTTIDQFGCGYLEMPLSEKIKNGNIVSGSIVNSFIAFDEIQSFDAHRALQLILFTIEKQREFNMPLSLMTATLPDVFVHEISDKYRLTPIILSNSEESLLLSRNNRKVKINFRNEYLTPEKVLKHYNNTDKNLIVVCNTVDSAMKLYSELSKKHGVSDSVLLHSRFTPTDRFYKESELYNINNKSTALNSRHIIISTQVIEVGIDISSYVLISELAPIDLLIQRAGRCQRWFFGAGKNRFGEFIVYLPMNENYAPYFELNDVMNNTKDALEEHNGEFLNWKLERKLVNDILTDSYKKYLNEYRQFKVHVNDVHRQKNKGQAMKLIRDIQSCSIAVYDKVEEIKKDVFNLEKISLHVGILDKNWDLLKGVKVCYDEESKEVEFKELPERPQVGDFYVFTPENIIYNRQMGFKVEFGHTATCFNVIDKTKSNTSQQYEYEKEFFIEHTKNVAAKVSEYISEDFILRQNFDNNEIIKIKALQVFFSGLHDLGKLTDNWVKYSEKAINERPLAHFNKIKGSNKPLYHDLISAILLEGAILKTAKKLDIKNLKGNDHSSFIGNAIINSLLYHHGKYAGDTSFDIQDIFELVDGWEIEINEYLEWFKLNYKKFYNVLNIDGKFENNLFSSINEHKKIKFIKYDNIVNLKNTSRFIYYVYFSYILRNADRDSLDEKCR